MEWINFIIQNNNFNKAYNIFYLDNSYKSLLKNTRC
jgi:hypothetical protein